jgi:hypothetical protein
MKHKTITFKDLEAVAAWLNRKHGTVQLIALAPGAGKYTALYAEIQPDSGDTEFIIERADELLDRSELRIITLAELANSIRNLKRFSKHTLKSLRTHSLDIIRQSGRYTVEPMRRGFVISREGGSHE